MSIYGYNSIEEAIEANKENIMNPALIKMEMAESHEIKREIMETQNTVLPPSELVIDPVSTVDTVLPAPPLSQASTTSSCSQGSLPESPLTLISSPYERRDEDSEAGEDGETSSRKEKSLGLLCQKFLIAMNEETRNTGTREVHLETVAKKMTVEKRRIYDIVNVMEALDAMSKTNKSYYRWNGLDELPKLMLELQKEAEEENLPARVLRVEQAMCSFTELSPRSKLMGRDIVGSMVSESQAVQTPVERKTRVDGRDKQGRNSLAQLCRRFLMVLLSNPNNTRRVSLDVASTVLIKDPETEGFEPPSRSRCRRLYDIANVLVALGLIKKVHYLFGTKKIPLFVYCGPEPDPIAKFDVNDSLEKLLTASSSAPQTPLMKATTAAMAQQLVLGKRSQSEANMTIPNDPSPKFPRMKSEDYLRVASNSLMMFAELAAERQRQENLRRAATSPSSPATQKSNNLVRSNNNDGLPKPQAQKMSDFPMSPLSSPMGADRRYTIKVGNSYHMSATPFGNIVLPTAPVWNIPQPPMRRSIGPYSVTDMSKSSPSISEKLITKAPLCTLPAPQPCIKPVLPPVSKYSVSSLLGESMTRPLPRSPLSSLNHKTDSPFQVVKKQPTASPKQPFGALHNRMN